MTKPDEHHALAHDLEVLRQSALKRRDLIRLAASTGLLALAGCSDDTASSPIDDESSGSTTAGTGSGGSKAAANGGSGAAGKKASAAAGTGGAAAGSGGPMAANSSDNCAPIPEEIVGPYPADGSNGVSGGPPPDLDPSMLPKGFPGDGGVPPGLPGNMAPPPSDTDGGMEDLLNVLGTDGIVRSDIRSSFAGASQVAQGVPMTVTLELVNSEDGCTPLADAAVYIWHCDREGDYSLYSEAVKDENYLRGVQATDKTGQLTFKTIVPGCYAGRWPHFHLQIYKNLASATDYKGKHMTTQLAIPKDVCDATYAERGYEKSAKNLAPLTLDGDLIFSDGYEAELLKVTGSVAEGFEASLTFGLKPL